MMTAFWCLQVNGGHSPGGHPPDAAVLHERGPGPASAYGTATLRLPYAWEAALDLSQASCEVHRRQLPPVLSPGFPRLPTARRLGPYFDSAPWRPA